jgi:NADPH:quinone reductase-like Zn-dependent oxidoreductase
MNAYTLLLSKNPATAWKKGERPPPAPRSGEVLIRVRAVSLNYRDLMIARGQYMRPLKEGIIPCSDGAGEVSACGPGVTQFKPGDRVMGSFFQEWITGPIHPAYHASALGGSIDGMLAEQVVLREDGIVRIPEGLSFEEASTLPCAGVTAWNALMEGPGRTLPGGSVLIQGSGGVSVFALQLARAAGLRVFGISSSDTKLQRLRALGMESGVNYKTNPNWAEEVRKLTGGEGVDGVVEVSGAIRQSLKAVKYGGWVCLIGGVGVGWDETASLGQIFGAGALVRPIFVGSVSMLRSLAQAIVANRIRPVIDQVFDFDHASEALAKLAGGSHMGKIVISVNA